MLKAFGSNLRDARKRAGQSQDSLGLSIGSDAEYIRFIEQGKIEPGVSRIAELAWHLNADPADLFRGVMPDSAK